MTTLLHYLLVVTLLAGNPHPPVKNAFVLQGSIGGREQGWIYLSYKDAQGKSIYDSAVITDHRFSFKGSVSEPTRAYISVRAERNEGNNGTNVFIEPHAMTVTIEFGRFEELIMTGSASQTDKSGLERQLNLVKKRWKTVTDTLMMVAKRDNFRYQALKNWALVPYFDQIREINLTFVNAHPRSYVSADALLYCIYDLETDTLRALYNSLAPNVQKSELGKLVADALAKRMIGVPGTTAAAFSSTDINGQPLSLSDFKGKYVLLDFWASWCLPCRELSPHLKELYAQYKAKGFEIIGIASDNNTVDAWKKAVAKDDLPWPQILEGSIGKQYNILYLPMQILIDPDGGIIARYGEGVTGENHAALDKKLEALFK